MGMTVNTGAKTCSGQSIGEKPDPLVRLKDIANRLISPHADKVYVAKEYTKADLRNDILEAIGEK